MKKLLPLGSIVTLKEENKKLMIMGHTQQNIQEQAFYDYIACLWPDGYIDQDHCYVFNHEDIDSLYFIGLQNIEEFKN